jgi:hypothetical protein
MINNKHLCDGNNISVYSKPSSDKTVDQLDEFLNRKLCAHSIRILFLYVGLYASRMHIMNFLLLKKKNKLVCIACLLGKLDL